MARTTRTTTQRGYGWTHRQARAAALAGLRDGAPCHLCGAPMYRTQQLDLDHNTTRTQYRGLAHSACNRRDGAQRGNSMRNSNRPHTTHSRQW